MARERRGPDSDPRATKTQGATSTRPQRRTYWGAIVSWGHHRLQDYRQTLPFLEIERRISPPGGESHHQGVKLATKG